MGASLSSDKKPGMFEMEIGQLRMNTTDAVVDGGRSAFDFEQRAAYVVCGFV